MFRFYLRNPPANMFGGWVAMLNHAVELLNHGYDHVVRLIIPVLVTNVRCGRRGSYVTDKSENLHSTHAVSSAFLDCCP
jgi:hypothetical protein